ncbi:MAG: M13 family metallopeptidase [Prevotellaceae bacterium]|nr:M13 family metallopeptidase [Candidatus Colivivens caballi]
MKAKQLILTIAMAATCMGCQNQLGIGIKLENMNDSVAPGTDFYQYACGGWIKNNPLKPEYARFGSFDAVAENNREQLKQLIEELATTKQEAGSVGQKIGDFYNMMMDSVRLNKDGFQPALADLKTIDELATREAAISQFIKNDVMGEGFIFGFGIGADMMNSSMNLLSVGQAGLSLGNKDYYTKDDEATVKIREAFKKHIVNMFKLVGDDEATATRKMNSVMDIEMKVAQGNKTSTELRDPASNYHKMSYADIKSEFTGFPWDEFWAAHGIADIDSIDMGQPEAIRNDIAILNSVELQQLKDWMQWMILNNNSSVLGDKIYAESFDFFGKTMSGKKEMQPRWKRAVSTVGSVLGEAVGEMYVKKYFPAENKERMLQLVKNLQVALGERIDQQDWMSDSTKAVAKDKLNAFYIKIGYPDKWKDYSKLNIDNSKTLYELSKDITRWAEQKEIEDKYKKPVDRDEWFMTPQTVNAYYNPTTNEICFPAGILQYPFFDMSADDAFNYGAIGVVIGHEMTHGFDDQGSQFDKNGNFNNWWTEGDAAKFKQKTQRMVDFFNGIEVLPGLKANGQLTLGENIADHGGLKIAFQAFQNATKDNPLPVIDGFTPEQRFFLAYAGVWAQNITEENMRQLTTVDPHSLGEWRVNGALPQIDAWYEAFGISEDDPMFIPKDKRVNVW